MQAFAIYARKRIILIPVVSLAISGCCHQGTGKVTNSVTEAGIPQRLMLGVQSSTGGALTLSPDGGALSVLYDNARLIWLAADPVVEGKTVKRWSGRLTIAARRRDLTVAIHFRGMAIGPAKADPLLKLTVDGQPVELGRPALGGDFMQCAETRFRSSISTVQWTAQLTQPPGEEAALHLDSVDISVSEADAPADKRAVCVNDPTPSQ